MKCRDAAWIVLAAAACSGTSTGSNGMPSGAASGAPSNLDGKWDVTFIDDRTVTSVTVTMSGTSADVLVVSASQGSAIAPDCTDTEDEADLSLDLSAAASIVGTAADVRRHDGAGCSGASAGVTTRTPSSTTVTATRSTSASSSFGTWGGQWNVVAGESACEVQLTGNAMTGTCGDTTLTGTLDGDVFSGQTSDGVQFAAQRQ